MLHVPVHARDADRVVALGADDPRHVGAVAVVVVGVGVLAEEVGAVDVVGEAVAVLVHAVRAARPRWSRCWRSGRDGRMRRPCPATATVTGPPVVTFQAAGRVHVTQPPLPAESAVVRAPAPRARRSSARRSAPPTVARAARATSSGDPDRRSRAPRRSSRRAARSCRRQRPLRCAPRAWWRSESKPTTSSPGTRSGPMSVSPRDLPGRHPPSTTIAAKTKMLPARLHDASDWAPPDATCGTPMLNTRRFSPDSETSSGLRLVHGRCIPRMLDRGHASATRLTWRDPMPERDQSAAADLRRSVALGRRRIRQRRHARLRVHPAGNRPWGGTRHGRDGVAAYATIFRDHVDGLWADADDFIDAGDVIVVLGRLRGHGKQPATNTRCTSRTSGRCPTECPRGVAATSTRRRSWPRSAAG